MMPKTKHGWGVATVLAAEGAAIITGVTAGFCGEPMTFCNPIDLDYPLRETGCHHEAADPCCLVYKGDYYLFGSKADGYWWSPDFVQWRKISPPILPRRTGAPTAMEYRGALYLTANGLGLFRSENPKDADSWEAVDPRMYEVDPALFTDDDGRVFLYVGCATGGKPTTGIELDPNRKFSKIGKAVECVRPLFAERGWEVRGDTNQGHGPGFADKAPWIEGSWMNKHGNRYYYQYAAPGTEFDTYGDGVCESDSPLGPFTYEPHSPFSFKPTGFITGAGHGATFRDKGGHYWHVATGVIAVRSFVERRIVCFPARFSTQGRLLAETCFGDLPQYLPGKNPTPEKGNLAGWMLLGYGTAATASSEHTDHPARHAFDESIKTWWQPAVAASNAWIEIDLGGSKTVHALQVNFAEPVGTDNKTPGNFIQKYRVMSSADGERWDVLIDRSTNTVDRVNAYRELSVPVNARYLRLTDCGMAPGYFGVSGFRIFGVGGGRVPDAITHASVVRDAADRRHVTVEWENGKGATGYAVRYGVSKAVMSTPFEVRGKTRIDIYSLNAKPRYWFTVDAFNENGITPMTEEPVSIE